MDDTKGTCPKGQITLWTVRDGTLQKQWEGETRTAVGQLALDLERQQIVLAMCHQDVVGQWTDSESVEVVSVGNVPKPARALLAKVSPVSALAVNDPRETVAIATCVE
jgi:hypothetical protein